MLNRILIAIFILSITSQSYALNAPLLVKETQGVARSGEMVHNGIPLAKADNITSISSLLISNGSSSIPATFEVLARWGGGHTDTSKPIKWVLVSFPASVSANGSGTYYLRDYGTPASITNSITMTNGSSSITVDTGPAEFTISETTGTLFDSITIGGNALASGNSSHNSTIQSGSTSAANIPTVTIERQNDHYVCIKSVGTYANTPVGSSSNQPLHYRIRYEFFAGSPTAVITHKFFWPGYSSSPDDSGTITVNNVNLQLPDVTGYSSTDIYATASLNYTGVSGETATVSQDRRTTFTNPQQATVSHGGTSQTTTQATNAAVINRAANGSLVATIGNMHLFEPQSMSTDPSGKLTVTVLDEDHPFAEAQGTWARIGVGAVAVAATFSDVQASVIAPVEHRLMAIPDAAYLATTNFHDKIPNTTSTSPEIQAWWTELGQLTTTTETWLANEKFYGLMTWGGLVRYPDTETGNLTTWEKIYDGANLTDYHNTWKNMTLHGLLSADPSELQDYAFNGARRMLNTQIIQADSYSSATSIRMGWGYSGYDRYRSDGNSSHSYFENLYMYYYLTGDLEVVDLLTVGAKTKAEWYTRNSGVLNDQTVRDEAFIEYVGRIFYQTASMFDFLGHASDSNYLDDWKHMYGHTATHALMLLDYNSTEYGFFSTDDTPTSPQVTEQSWMDAIYTTEGLYRLYQDYGDINLGSSSLSISRIFEAVARGFWDYTRTTHAESDGTWGGRWTNSQTITYAGNAIGGTLQSVTAISSGDDHLYTDGKANVATAIIRGGEFSGDTTLKQNGLDGLAWLSTYGTFTSYGDDPLAKISGIAFSRLADGVSYFDTSLICYSDSDNDTYGDINSSGTSRETCLAGEVTNHTDCDDFNANIHPGATDIPDNGIDEDCSGSDATASPTCATDPTLCTTESECTTAGWNYCSGACQAQACPSPITGRGLKIKIGQTVAIPGQTQVTVQ